MKTGDIIVPKEGVQNPYSITSTGSTLKISTDIDKEGNCWVELINHEDNHYRRSIGDAYEINVKYFRVFDALDESKYTETETTGLVDKTDETLAGEAKLSHIQSEFNVVLREPKKLTTDQMVSLGLI